MEVSREIQRTVLPSHAPRHPGCRNMWVDGDGGEGDTPEKGCAGAMYKGWHGQLGHHLAGGNMTMSLPVLGPGI